MKITIVLSGLCLIFSMGALVSMDALAGRSQEFATDVPGITEDMLAVDFWIDRIGKDRARMTPVEIDRLNTTNFARGESLYDLSAFPNQVSRERVLALIDGTSRVPGAPRYYADGGQVPGEEFAALEASVKRDAIPAEVSVRWGMVVQRGSMRSYPTNTQMYKDPRDIDLDRLQETGVFPGQQVALLQESADGEWWFAVNYHYAAWLPKAAVAVGNRAEIETWLQSDKRLVVTGAQVETNYNPEEPRTSRQLLDMGVSLPLLSPRDSGFSVHGQNPHASYIVRFPVRDEAGKLEFEPALIARGRDVRVGTLPYRPSLVLRQAFKFLGERYGWGHDYNGRDCTGFVGEVYKAFGILMPRNSGQQGHSGFAPTRFFAEGDREARLKALGELNVGDLIYIPGHVMLYIGSLDGEPYVIHDVTGLSYFDGDGTLYSGILSGVSVTPLKPLRLSRDKSYVDAIYAIKSLIGATSS